MSMSGGNIQTGFVKECAKCGCYYADTVSSVPPVHISEIPSHVCQTLERGGKSFIEFVEIETRYGYCESCDVKQVVGGSDFSVPCNLR